MVYVSLHDEDFPPEDNPTVELAAGYNIVFLKNIDVEIVTGEAYKWRVDCVSATSGKKYKQRRTGQTWTFTISE